MSNVNVCEIEDDVKEALKKFRFRKAETSAALILKVDKQAQKICIDELVEDTSLDDLQEVLPGHQPRYVVYTCRLAHPDGRVSFPMCFIYVTPRDCQTDLQIMYAGTKIAVQREANLPLAYEVRELDELTDEWLYSKLLK
ncbi:glia maturation factor beta [Cimex lectularius]|uniref:ADF-H domain-containing protein n=1 Tax=Cimex lectularius TaxID=79782 RepID=A0A8I6S3Y8_CIMLE|nr:glia maturation factor beta [Cimex lectularius]XP_014255587.1 glia maturation factor beta [Cimex lectularius]